MSVCDHDIIERAHNRKELREKIAAIIVRKVLQEDYDDLVEGYLDEILMAADEIILLPAYQAVAQTYYDNLALLSERAELLAAVERMRGALEPFALAADNMDGDEPDSLFIYDSPESAMIDYADLRRARAALTTASTEQGERG
jgi:hypothetical protein